MKYQPIIIIGAARSGTNMLRDIITKLPEYGTWDCDEINPIWRHGNINYPHDEFSVSMATPKVITFVRKEFEKLAEKLLVPNIVEKTTATSLRVGYVHKIFPEAKFIFIFRDGRDVAVSAVKRWKAPFDFYYSWKKFRYVPKSDMPYIAYYYILNRIKRIWNGKSQLPTWGPRYEGIDLDVQNFSLLEVCAIQWKKFIENTLEQLKLVDDKQVLKIKYENFVKDPNFEMQRICQFLNVNKVNIIKYNLIDNVNEKSVGNWKKLTIDEQNLLNYHTRETLIKLGYKV